MKSPEFFEWVIFQIISYMSICADFKVKFLLGGGNFIKKEVDINRTITELGYVGRCKEVNLLDMY